MKDAEKRRAEIWAQIEANKIEAEKHHEEWRRLTDRNDRLLWELTKLPAMQRNRKAKK